ncbi:glutaredoxin [Tribonema minus]|uniref:Glutaredoxin n=1 Tax=Tribonema minus TaxID=303371 RepID=A0A835YTN8_9STRA|nr:glutaredoxin [Tribonema minus]
MKVTMMTGAVLLSIGAVLLVVSTNALSTSGMTAATVTGQGSSFINGASMPMADSAPPKMAMLAPADFVKQQIASQDIVVFSKSYCPYCAKTKALFQSLDAGATVIELDQRDDGGDIQAALAEITGQRTVPNVFVKGTHVGGNDATQKANSDGTLKSLMNGARKE